MVHKVKILKIKQLTHNVKSIITEKPESYKFKEGQFIEISINKPLLKNKKRSFSIASINSDLYLEFIIKIYKERNAITKEMDELKEGETLLIESPKGEIEFKGKGTFIAGGTGITPFISIMKQLKEINELKENKLFFSNKTKEDIILKEELDSYKDLEKEYILTKNSKRIDNEFLKNNIKNFNQFFYICGPIRMVGEIQSYLVQLGLNPEFLVLET